MMMPLGRRWKSYSTESTTTVCPALLPPCREETEAGEEGQTETESHRTNGGSADPLRGRANSLASSNRHHTQTNGYCLLVCAALLCCLETPSICTQTSSKLQSLMCKPTDKSISKMHCWFVQLHKQDSMEIMFSTQNLDLSELAAPNYFKGTLMGTYTEYSAFNP